MPTNEQMNLILAERDQLRSDLAETGASYYHHYRQSEYKGTISDLHVTMPIGLAFNVFALDDPEAVNESFRKAIEEVQKRLAHS